MVDESGFGGAPAPGVTAEVGESSASADGSTVASGAAGPGRSDLFAAPPPETAGSTASGPSHSLIGPGAIDAGAGPLDAAMQAAWPTGREGRPLVVDVGGGSGTSAVALGLRGCRVIVVDSSIDALAILRRRAVEAGVSERIDGIQGDADRVAGVVPVGTADLVLCHHLLEEVDDPAAAVAAMAAVLRPGGVLSVLAAGRYGAVLAQAWAGRGAEARAILADADGRFAAHDPSRRRFELSGLTQLLRAAGLEVEWTAGIGLGTADPLLEAELGRHPIFRELGHELHVLARRPG